MAITREYACNLRREAIAASRTWIMANQAKQEEKILDSVRERLDTAIDEVNNLIATEQMAIHGGKKKSTRKLKQYLEIESILTGTHPNYQH